MKCNATWTNFPSQELSDSCDEYGFVLQPMSSVMVQVLTPITKLYNLIRLAYLMHYNYINTHQYDT